jgi:predicted Zn-ribbon and HTH transcriptional regulator
MKTEQGFVHKCNDCGGEWVSNLPIKDFDSCPFCYSTNIKFEHFCFLIVEERKR